MYLAGQLEDLFHEVGEAHHQAYIETDGADPEWPCGTLAICGRDSVRSSTPASPKASSSTSSSSSQTSSRSRPLAPTGPDTTLGSLSLDTHRPTYSKVKFRVPFSAKRGEIEDSAERLELVRA
jgi:hypothetical protein